jgi:hypothetical protein
MHPEKFGIFGLTLVAAALITTLVLTVGAIADNQSRQSMGTHMQDRDSTRDRTRDQTPIYGSMLMTEREREEHRAMMRSLKTEQERQAYRAAHHQKMQERARSQGMALPEPPPGISE